MSNMREDHLVIQLNSGDTSTDPKSSWVSKVSNDLIELPHLRSSESIRWENQSIYRIPWSMKELTSRAYQPQTVSIGPYHHGERQLEVMEEHKQRALLTFLERSKRPLQYYVDALAPEVENLKDAYHQLDPKWKDDDEAFLKLMIVDGCFILEIMRIATARTEALIREMGYAGNDPVFSNHGKLAFVPHLKRDMLKLENQLPLPLLIKLLLAEDGLHRANYSSKRRLLTSLILEFFLQKSENGNMEACLHILDLYRKSQFLLRLSPEVPELPLCGANKERDFILSATKLSESGISFKQSRTSNLNDISFRGGVLELPLVTVDDTTESECLNMIALERFQIGAGDGVRSFVCFMSTIINGAGDARLLQSCGILQNALGSDKAVAKLFMSLSRDVGVDPDNELELVKKKLSRYCRKPLPRWMAYAKHNYFTNPWVGLSVVATIFVFVLAGIQTVYAVIDYHHSRKGK